MFENNMTSITEGFEGLLLLNPCTAELTFISITKKLSGSYCVRIEDSGYLIIEDSEYLIVKQFFITVYGE